MNSLEELYLYFKNYLARTLIACQVLVANYRWALLGTPIINLLEELYPYFKSLNVPFTRIYNIFKAKATDYILMLKIVYRSGFLYLYSARLIKTCYLNVLF